MYYEPESFGQSQADEERPRVGDLYFLWHAGGEEVISGYGLVAQEGRKDHLVGLLMADRPRLADPAWLARIEEAYGEYQLVPMTEGRKRGILCQMRVAQDSLHLLRTGPHPRARDIRTALTSLLDNPPNPIFKVRWNLERGAWQSQFWIGLPEEMQSVFKEHGYGCFASDRGDLITFITHAADGDIESFRRAEMLYRWELVEMPSAPLVRFQAVILDNPWSPYMFEHFLNVADPEQTAILARLAGQEQLCFDYYGTDYEYRYSKYLEHPAEMRGQLDELIARAIDYQSSLREEWRDFDLAKLEYQRRVPLRG